MSNSSNSSSKSLTNKAFAALLVLVLVGLADAAYLTAVHYTGEGVACSIVKGCEQVLTSKYSIILGIPLAVFGVVYYAVLFLALYYFRATSSERFWKFFQLTAMAGGLATAYLVYLQVAVIKAICQYCMLSAGLTTIILIVLLSFRRQGQKETN